MPTQATLAAADAVEIFRFAHMRAAQLPKPSLKKERFITNAFFNSLPATTITSIAAGGNILHQGLLPTATNANPRAAAEAELVKFRAGTNGYVAANFYSSTAALYGSTAPFKFYDAVLEMWQASRGTIIGTAFINNVETILGITVAAHLASANEKKVRLWDNLMSSYVTTNINSMREHYIQCLRILNAIEKVSANAAAYNSAAMRRLWKATPILPKPVFPIPKILNTIIETITQPVNANSIATAAALTQYLNHLAALRELRIEYLYQRSLRKSRFQNVCQLPLDDLFQTVDYAALCARTSATNLDHADFINLSNTKFLLITTISLVRQYSNNATSVLLTYILQRIRQEMIFWAARAGLDNGRLQLMLVGNRLIPLTDLCRSSANVSVCDLVTGASIPAGSGHIKPIGVADYLSIKQELLKYAEGEIAHVENIMAFEIKRRTHRDLIRSETITTQESSTETEDMRDTQSTERFSLQSAASEMLQKSTQFSTNVSAGYSAGVQATGIWNINGNVGFASNNSQQNSTSNGSSYAKDVVDKAVSRVIEKTRTLRQTTVVKELEDTTEHGFKNDLAGATNVVGQYHWLDKYFLCKVVNQGKRMMFEFMVPEPAAFHIYAMAVQKAEGTIIEKPIAPDDESWDETLSSAEQLNFDNFDRWAARYNVEDMPTPPEEYQSFGYAKSINSADGDVFSEVITLPIGYQAQSAAIRFFYRREGSSNSWLYITVGNQSLYSLQIAEGSHVFLELDNEVGFIPIAIANQPATYANVSITLKCVPTQLSIIKWQIEAYTAIIQAYEIKLDEYNRKVTATMDTAIKGQNPDLNRKTEQEELKRGCLELFTDQKWNAFDAMRNWQGAEQYPQFHNPDARAEGAYVKFFEQGFEWGDMSYIFYPYFWGRKRNWVTIKNMQDPDPLFSRFLQAGYARVVVPVRPGFEEAILHYCDTGQIWNGDSVPTIEDDLYLSIIDEIREQEEIVGDENLPVVGEPWIIKVPTNLVRLNASTSPTLPDFSADLLDE